jgi:hypothetical protein
MLSMLMFQPDYIEHLIDIGEQDAEARSDEIEAFLGRAQEDAAGDATAGERRTAG